jgi:hypothetical protein
MSAPPTYPVADELLAARWGTLYLLSDARVRIRDAHAVLTVTRFFARKGVDLNVRPLLAEHSPTFDARELQLVFQQAAEILSSYQLTTSNNGLRITHRLREARFDDLRERASRERTAAKAGRRDDPEAEFVDRWLELIGDLERALDQQPDALHQTLDAAARLFAIRWPKKAEQTFLKGLLGQKNKQRRGGRQRASVQTQYLAASLGTNPSAMDNLIAKREP